MKKYHVVLEFLNELGKPENNLILDYTPKTKEEATNIAENYPITNGEQVCVYEYSDSDSFNSYNVSIVKVMK